MLATFTVWDEPDAVSDNQNQCFKGHGSVDGPTEWLRVSWVPCWSDIWTPEYSAHTLCLNCCAVFVCVYVHLCVSVVLSMCVCVSLVLCLSMCMCVCVCCSGDVKLSNFTCARLIDSELSLIELSSASALWYRAPELLLGVTRAASSMDIWSCGFVSRLSSLTLNRCVVVSADYQWLPVYQWCHGIWYLAYCSVYTALRSWDESLFDLQCSGNSKISNFKLRNWKMEKKRCRAFLSKSVF